MANFSVCLHFGYNIHDYRKAARQRLSRCEHRSTVTWGLNEIGIGVITGGKKGDGGTKKEEPSCLKNPLFLVKKSSCPNFDKRRASKSFPVLTIHSVLSSCSYVVGLPGRNEHILKRHFIPPLWLWVYWKMNTKKLEYFPEISCGRRKALIPVDSQRGYMVSQKRNLFPGKGCQMTLLMRAETMVDKLDSSDIHISSLLFKSNTLVRRRYDGLVDWGWGGLVSLLLRHAASAFH